MKKIRDNITEILFVLGFINIDIAFFMQNFKYGLTATGISLIIISVLIAVSSGRR
ncbi:MAG: hypothetical protein VB018_13245 [Lachnospiraceae bacterium]|nr:hypothetical protein [Lachnospiraceae bacterium]